MFGKRQPSERKPAGPRPVTAVYLRNAALHYLSARAASASMVRQTLERRARRRLGERSLPADIVALIDAAISDLTTLGLIDDARFAEGRAAALARKGLSRRRIAVGLKQKGIGAETGQAAIAADLDDLTQARRFIIRKRLGPLRRGGATPATRDKDLRALARAGFSYAISVTALADPGDE